MLAHCHVEYQPQRFYKLFRKVYKPCQGFDGFSATRQHLRRGGVETVGWVTLYHSDFPPPTAKTRSKTPPHPAPPPHHTRKLPRVLPCCGKPSNSQESLTFFPESLETLCRLMCVVSGDHCLGKMCTLMSGLFDVVGACGPNRVDGCVCHHCRTVTSKAVL